MTNDIEAAARLALDALVELEWSDLFREYDSDPLPEIACPDCGAFQNPAGSHHGNCHIYPAICALRSALAHATRGDAVAWCVYDAMGRMCGGPYLDRGVADTFASRTPWPKEGPFTVVPLYARAAPPPATGEADRPSQAEVDAALAGLLRRGGIDEINAALNVWRREKSANDATGEAKRCDDHGREGCIDCEPATGAPASVDSLRLRRRRGGAASTRLRGDVHVNYRARHEGRVARVTPFHATAMQDTPGLSGLGVSSEWLWRVRVDDEIVTDAGGHSLFVEVDEAKRVAERHLAAGSPVRWEEIP